MNIFDNFGFQMVVATPLKSVMTLEPFIGGACFVEISGRHDSGVLLIEYDDEGKRLKLPERARAGGEAAVAPAAAVTAAPDVVEVPETAADAVIAEHQRDALNWALMRGSRSGRVAWQFAKDWAGTRKTARSGRSR